MITEEQMSSFVGNEFDMSERQSKTIDAFIIPTQAITVCGFFYFATIHQIFLESFLKKYIYKRNLESGPFFSFLRGGKKLFFRREKTLRRQLCAQVP